MVPCVKVGIRRRVALDPVICDEPSVAVAAEDLVQNLNAVVY